MGPYENQLRHTRPTIQLIDTLGDGTGTHLWGAISATPEAPVDLLITAPASFEYYLKSVVIAMYAATNQVMTGFGSISALTNGLLVGMLDPEDTFHQFAFPAITKNCCFARWGCTIEPVAGVATTHLAITFDWEKAFKGLEHIKPGWSLCLRFQDDLTSLGTTYPTGATGFFLSRKLL
jgi:hypothetical protein